MAEADLLRERQGAFRAFLRERGLVEGEGEASPEALWRAGRVAADPLADALAAFHGLARLAGGAALSPAAELSGLSRRYLRDSALLPAERDGALVLLAADPGRSDEIAAVRLALGGEPPLAVVSFEDYDRLFERLAGGVGDGAPAGAPADEEALVLSDSVEALQDLARGAPVVRIVDELLERAIGLGATDIHIETGRDALVVRLRVDGYLRTDRTFPRTMAPAIISRVKILARLDIAERRLPQDGRAAVRVGREEADLRVAIAPTLHGETAVLRILLKDSRLLDFDRIGMSAADQATLGAMLAEPHGLLIVTGPTGSGKTTTLAAAVSRLNDPSRKIMTVEDPIEYQMPGVHQTQVRPSIGLDFATALRSFLRHDPDVIMVGEMRDRPTAAIGVQAALTGHLVLTTLHTNTAADAVVRLADMGVEPYLIASTLKGVLGQRLVRRLCEHCRRPDGEEAALAAGLAAERGLRLDARALFHAPVGCEACGHSGYRGRIGIFEAMRVDDGLRALIRREPDSAAIAAEARARGMTSMVEDGLAKAGEGLTSLEEVMRAAS